MGNHRKILRKLGEEIGKIYKITRKFEENFENIAGNFKTFY